LRRLLLRAVVITGGCAAGIILSGIISGEAHADDRPRLGNGLIRNTVTHVLDDVLPDRPERQPEQQPKPKKGKGKKDDDSGGSDHRPHTPVRDVVDKVRDTVAKVGNHVTAPAHHDEPISTGHTDPQPDTAVNELTGDLVADAEPPDVTTAASSPGQTQVTPTPAISAARQYAAPTGDSYHCGADWQRMVRIAVLYHANSATVGYTQPTPPIPSRPDQDVTPAFASLGSPFTGLHQDATLAARASIPHTTAVRIPGCGQAADGMPRRPDPPSG
jgi:hypothetical protein